MEELNDREQQAKKEQDLSNIKYALELGLKNGVFSSLEEIVSVINSFEGLKL